MLDALGCIGTAVALFSVVKRQHEGFALCFVTTRMFEAAVIVIGVASIMAVVTLRQTAAEADAASLVAVGARAPSLMHFPAGAGPDAGLQRRVAGLPDVPVWTRSASHSGDGAHRSSAAHLVHARNGARRQREGVRGWEVVGTAPIFFWELSLRLWMTFKGFNPSAPILAAPSAEWGSPATS